MPNNFIILTKCSKKSVGNANRINESPIQKFLVYHCHGNNLHVNWFLVSGILMQKIFETVANDTYAI